MKAILRWGLSFICLLVVTSALYSWTWVTPVTKRPYPHAPDMFNSPQYFYFMPDGYFWGPYYYLRPPYRPGGCFLPGPIGDALMKGYCPLAMLKDKEAMTLGDMPLLKNAKKKKGEGDGPPSGPPPGGPPGFPPSGPPGNMGPPQGYGGVPGPYPMMQGPGGMPPGGGMQLPIYAPNGPQGMNPYAGMPGPYPMLRGPGAIPPGANVQMPQYGTGAPPGMMPPGGIPTTSRQPLPMSSPGVRPLGHYTGGVTPYVNYGQDAEQSIWLAQNAVRSAPSFVLPQARHGYATAVVMPPMRSPGFGPMGPVLYYRSGPTGAMLIPSPYGHGGPMPGMPGMPGYPGRSGMNAIPLGPTLPGMPTLPGTPGMPGTPMLPGMPTMPGTPMLPGMPTMPGTPMLPGMPTMPGTPMLPGMPTMPAASGMGMHSPGFPYYGPMDRFSNLQHFGPMGTLDHLSNLQTFDPMRHLQMPQLAQVPAVMPRMDMMPTPQTRVSGNAFPTHPFTRSPRDFFMWGESMEDERGRGNRVFPVGQ